MKKPLVSIIAICYNHEKYVEETLDTIRLQSYPNLEVYIIDSNSKDESAVRIAQYIQKYQLDSWQFHRQETPTSICQNLNFALQRINGDYYQVISCDDLIDSDKITTQIEILSNSDFGYDLIYGDYSHVDEASKVIEGEEQQLRKSGFSESNLPPSGHVFCEILGTWYIHSITCLISRKASIAIGGYDENLVYEDTDFFLRLARDHKILGDLSVVGYYRILEDSFFRTRSLEFYVSTCQLYAKHLDESLPCFPAVRRLHSHYLDVVFQMDPETGVEIFGRNKPKDFDSYLSIYIRFYQLTKSLKYALMVKQISKKILNKLAI